MAGLAWIARPQGLTPTFSIEQAAQDNKSRRPDLDVLRLVFVGDGQSARESVRLLAIVHD